MLKLDMIQTLAFGGVVLALGYGIRRAVPILGKYNLPAPILGGLVVSIAILVARQFNATLVTFDTTLREPLMVAFFTTIGFGASGGLLRKGGPQVLLFFVLSAVAAILQNVVGAAAAMAVGKPPLFGVLCGSVTLTGGPATGLAFAPQFEAAGVEGAASIAVACAMGGIVAGGIIGGPVGSILIERLKRKEAVPPTPNPPTLAEVVEKELPGPSDPPPPGEDPDSFALLRSVGVVLLCMGIGTWVGGLISSVGMTLPAYIGAMLTAAVVRNIDDFTGLVGLSQHVLDEIGNVSLSFFLVLSLMTLELWRLADAALPLGVVLAVQIGLIAVLCFWPIFPRMGKDYDAAVMAGGFCGFMMGTTANAMANMDALARRYGPAPRAFLVVPLVGAFFIDFFNAVLVQTCLNLFK